MRKWVWEQIKGAFFALPLMLLVFGLYHGYLIPHRMEMRMQGVELTVLLIAIIIVSVLLHEVLHGIGWLLFRKGRACRIVFQRKGFLPVCKCRSFLGASHYLAGRLLPLWTMGTVGIVGLFICPGTCSFIGAEFIFYLSGIDIAEAFSILKNVNGYENRYGVGDKR